MMKRIASALMATAFIAGCSSGVDLDSAQFKQIQIDIGKIVPQYKD